MSSSLEIWHEGFKACLKECLPFEIGRMEREGYDPLGLCICMLSAIETGHETECGIWRVKRQEDGSFLVSFRKTAINAVCRDLKDMSQNKKGDNNAISKSEKSVKV